MQSWHVPLAGRGLRLHVTEHSTACRPVPPPYASHCVPNPAEARVLPIHITRANCGYHSISQRPAMVFEKKKFWGAKCQHFFLVKLDLAYFCLTHAARGLPRLVKIDRPTPRVFVATRTAKGSKSVSVHVTRRRLYALTPVSPRCGPVPQPYQGRERAAQRNPSLHILRAPRRKSPYDLVEAPVRGRSASWPSG